MQKVIIKQKKAFAFRNSVLPSFLPSYLLSFLPPPFKKSIYILCGFARVYHRVKKKYCFILWETEKQTTDINLLSSLFFDFLATNPVESVTGTAAPANSCQALDDELEYCPLTSSAVPSLCQWRASVIIIFIIITIIIIIRLRAVTSVNISG